MKALSVGQPWAELLVRGVKTIETRSWSTAYRGPVLIHATKTMPVNRDQALRVGRYTVSRGAPTVEGESLWLYWQDYPGVKPGAREHRIRLWQGCLLGYGTLLDVVPIGTARKLALDTGQFELGDFSAAAGMRWGFVFTGLTRLPVPLLLDGKQRLWWVPTEVEEALRAMVDPKVVAAAGR